MTEHSPPSMSGPSEGQSTAGFSALHMPPRDSEGGLNSCCTASLPHMAGASGVSNASPGISLKPRLPERLLRRRGADCGGGPQNAVPSPPLISASHLQYCSGSESSASASELEPPSGGSFQGFSGTPLTSQEDGGRGEALQDPPDLPPPPLPKLKFRTKFFQSTIQQILQLKKRGAGGGGAHHPCPPTSGPNHRFFPAPLNSNSLWGSGHSPDNWVQVKQLSRGSLLPETVSGVPKAAVPRGSGGASGSVLGGRTPETAVGEEAVLPPLPPQQRSPGLVSAPRDSGARLRAGPSELGKSSKHSLAAFPWFHGTLSRLRAAQLVLLGGAKDHGLFLLRHSQTRPQHLVLTLNCHGKAKHVLVSLNEDGWCWVENLMFRSISNMLEYFWLHSIPLKSERVCNVTLLSYVEAPHWFTALPPSPPGWRKWCQRQAQVVTRDIAQRCRDFVKSHVGEPEVAAVSRCLFKHFLEYFVAEVTRVAAEDRGGACGGAPPNAIATPLRPFYHPRVPLW